MSARRRAAARAVVRPKSIGGDAWGSGDDIRWRLGPPICHVCKVAAGYIVCPACLPGFMAGVARVR